MQQQMLPGITGQLDALLSGFSLNTAVIIAGVDGQGGHLHTVNHPGGHQECHDVISYVAVGSGEIHAIQSMIGFCHSATEPLTETVFRVLASKQRAELAPGVGRETDLIVIGRDGPRILAAQTMETLDTLIAKAAEETRTSLRKKTAGLSLEFESLGSDTEAVVVSAQEDGQT